MIRLRTLRLVQYPACVLLMFLHARALPAQPSPAATTAFNSYAASVENRLNQQHQLASTFLILQSNSAAEDARLRRGELVIEKLTPSDDPPGALLHHWRATAFVPGAHASDFYRLLHNIDSFPTCFAPQITQATLLRQAGDDQLIRLRIRQKHIVIVVIDATFAVKFGQLDNHNGYSLSRSTQIQEIASPGTRQEHVLAHGQDHGFLWRSNTDWTWQQRDGGLYLQVESISLSRSVPAALNWAVRPLIESIPRDSLEFTLHSVVNALHK